MQQGPSLYSRIQRHPKYIFLASAITYFILFWSSPFLGPIYLAIICTVVPFYIAFIAPNGKDWGDQRRRLFAARDAQSGFTIPAHILHKSEYMVNKLGMCIYTQTWEPRGNISEATVIAEAAKATHKTVTALAADDTKLERATIESIALVPKSSPKASAPSSLPSSALNNKPKGLILILHGYADHSSGLKHLIAQWLVSEGYVVAGIDYIGHGRSDGLHVDVTTFDPIIDDCLQYIHIINRKYADLPLFLFAESMGGAVCYLLATQHPHLFKGAVLSAPMCGIADDMHPPWIVTQILLLVCHFFPLLPITPTPDVADYAFKRKDIYEEIKRSVIYYSRMPRLSTAANMLFSSIYISQHLPSFTIPFLLMHGTADKVTDMSMSKKLYRESQSKDKTLKLYTGAYHSLLIGEEESMVHQIKHDILEWLDERSVGYVKHTEEELNGVTNGNNANVESTTETNIHDHEFSNNTNQNQNGNGNVSSRKNKKK